MSAPTDSFSSTCDGRREASNALSLSCGVCYEPFHHSNEHQRPRSLQCGHSFCDLDVKKLHTDGRILCPICRGVTLVKHLDSGAPLNRALIELIELAENNRKTSINRLSTSATSASPESCATGCGRSAEWYCFEDAAAMCEEHKVQSHTLPFQKSHRICTIEERQRTLQHEERISVCPHHHQKVVLYCESCTVLCCPMCALHGEHKSHQAQCRLIEEISVDAREKLAKLVHEIETEQPWLESEASVLSDLNERLIRSHDEAAKCIKDKFAQLTKVIQIKQLELLEQLNASLQAAQKQAELRLLSLTLCGSHATVALEDIHAIAALSGSQVLLNLEKCEKRRKEVAAKIDEYKIQLPLVSDMKINGLDALEVSGLAELEFCEVELATTVERSAVEVNFSASNSRDADASDIAEAIGQHKNLTSVNLMNNEIGDVGASLIAAAIRLSKSVTNLDLYYNKVGVVGASAIAETIKQSKRLAIVNLGHNRIGDAGASAIAESIISSKSLSSLNLDTNWIGDAGACSIAEAIKQNRSLSTLNVDNNEIGDAGASAIAESVIDNKTLTSLTLSHNQIGDVGARSIAEAIKHHESLTNIDLGHNRINAAGALHTAAIIKQNKSLKSMNLCDNQMGVVGVSSVSEAIKQNASLTSLRLDNNGIEDAGAAAVAEAIKQNKSLISLNLSRNRIGTAGASSIAEAIKCNKSLADVNLHGNGIGDVGVSSIAEAIKQHVYLTSIDFSDNRIGDVGALAIAGSIMNNESLTNLNLSDNRIGHNAVFAIAEAIKLKKNLTSADLFGNRCGDEGYAAIAAALKR